MEPITKDEGRKEEKAHDGHTTGAYDRKEKKEKKDSPLSENIKLLLTIASTVMAVVLFIVIPFLWWGQRYVLEQGKRVGILFGEPTFFLIHVATYFIVAASPWFLRYKKKSETPMKVAHEVFVYAIVVMVLIANTWNVTTATRHLVAERAEEMSDESVTYVYNQFGASARETSDIVILDQGITKVMSYLYVIVRNDFPEFDLRTASLHMVPLDKHKDEVWDIIQEGSQHKDREFMSYPTGSDPSRTSLVGQTIKEGRVKYCRDIAHPEQGGDDCKSFEPPPSGFTAYRSLICFPLETSFSEAFASICFDSKLDHAFDPKIVELEERIDKQMSQLSGLLQFYRNDTHTFQDSQLASQPPPPDGVPRRAVSGRHRRTSLLPRRSTRRRR